MALTDLFNTYDVLYTPTDYPTPNLDIYDLIEPYQSFNKQIKVENKENSNKDRKWFEDNIITQSYVHNPILSDYTFEQMLKHYNIPAKITSGYREGAVTKQGKPSNHSKKDSRGNSMAYDIVPISGNFEDLSVMYTHPQIKQWMLNHGFGILEETTPEIMKRTGATGKHWHIGPDQNAIINYKNKTK